MPLIPTHEVSPGRILARPIEDSMGRILINEGEILTEQLLAVLQKRGFVEIDVRPETKDRRTAMLEQKVEKRFTDRIHANSDVIALKKEIDQRFHNVSEQDPRMQTIRLMTQKVLVENLMETHNLE